MSNIQKFYPLFEKNQVLTASQLNNVSEFLFQQSRLTRARLIGSGIACGFEIIEQTTDNIKVSKGIGVTSEGYLIDLAECNLDTFREYTLPDSYVPFDNITSPIYELVEDPNGELSGTASPLNQFTDIENYVLVLYLECQDLDNSACLGDACDEIGKSRVFTVRKLLISEGDITGVVSAAVNSSCGDGSLNGTTIQAELTPYAIARPVIKPGDIDTTTGTNVPFVQFSEKYTDILAGDGSSPATKGFPGLAAKMSQTYTAYETLLFPIYEGDPFANLNDKITQIENFIGSGDGLGGFGYQGAQYIYDAVKEMAKAYNEFVAVACQVEGLCCACLGRYPKHLYVGLAGVRTKENETLPYRHRWIASAITNDQEGLTKQLIQLHKRMVLMLEMLDLSAINNPQGMEAKWTPSCEKKGLLDNRSIPFYYDVDTPSRFQFGTLEDVWQAHVDKDCVGLVKAPITYIDNLVNDTAPATPQSTPLHYSFDDKDFFRSGGHVGRLSTGTNSAGEALQDIINNHNLPVKIMQLQLEDPGTTDAVEDLCDFNDLNADYLSARERLKDAILATTYALRHSVDIVYAASVSIINDRDGESVGVGQSEISTRTFGADFNIDTDDYNFPNTMENAYTQSFYTNFIADGGGIAGPGGKIGPMEAQMTRLYNHIKDLDFKDFDMGIDTSGTVATLGFFAKWSSTLTSLVNLKVVIDEQIVKRSNATSTPNTRKAIAAFHEMLRVIDRFFYSSYHQDMSVAVALRNYRLNYLKDNNPRVLDNFIKKHPGIIHGAGSPFGGTYIMVTPGAAVNDPNGGGSSLNENTIIGDFYLPYVCCVDSCASIPCPTNDDLELPVLARPFYVRFNQVFETVNCDAETFTFNGKTSHIIDIVPELSFDRTKYANSDVVLQYYNFDTNQLVVEDVSTNTVRPVPEADKPANANGILGLLDRNGVQSFIYDNNNSNVTLPENFTFKYGFKIITNEGSEIQSNICEITINITGQIVVEYQQQPNDPVL